VLNISADTSLKQAVDEIKKAAGGIKEPRVEKLKGI